MNNDKATQELVRLLKARAEISGIEKVLGQGANVNDIDAIHALEDSYGDQAWLDAVLKLPAMAKAWQLREDADQAAFDLSAAIDAGDLAAAAEALAIMREAGDDADMTLEDLTFLGEAVACRASLPLIQLLVEAGADPNGLSDDARDELNTMPEDAWRDSIERFFDSLPKK